MMQRIDCDIRWSKAIEFPIDSHADSLLRKIERRDGYSASFAILVTLLLTSGLSRLSSPCCITDGQSIPYTSIWLVRALVGLVLLFDIYTICQQLQIFRIRHERFSREELFRLISENAADMIAVVDGNGKRLYNSPAYETFSVTRSRNFRTRRRSNRFIPTTASRRRSGGRGAHAGSRPHDQYRMRHKDGTLARWNPAPAPCSTHRGSRKADHREPRCQRAPKRSKNSSARRRKWRPSAGFPAGSPTTSIIFSA